MTQDELLREYEEAWRGAALEGRAQFYGVAAGGRAVETTPGTGYATCAVLILKRTNNGRIPLWRCACGWETQAMWCVMMHLNNAHHWSWDQFANKFRDELAQGQERAAS